MKLHQVLTGATNTFDDKAAIAVGSVDDHPFTVEYNLLFLLYLCKELNLPFINADGRRWLFFLICVNLNYSCIKYPVYLVLQI